MRRHHSPRGWWVLWAVIPCGWLTWVGFGYAARVTNNPRWAKYTVAYFAMMYSPVLILNVVGDGAAAGLMFFGLWLVALVHVVLARPEYVRLTSTPLDRARDEAGTRVKDRDEALSIVRHQPELAREMGIGRPDVPGANAAGLVDVNHVPAAVLETLDGVDHALANRIAGTREEVGGFTSLEDFGAVMELDGLLVERLRGGVVFL